MWKSLPPSQFCCKSKLLQKRRKLHTVARQLLWLGHNCPHLALQTSAHLLSTPGAPVWPQALCPYHEVSILWQLTRGLCGPRIHGFEEVLQVNMESPLLGSWVHVLTSLFPLWSRCRQGIAFPLTHAQERGFHCLKRPRCPWAPMLCCSQKILLVPESWMVVPLSVSPPRAWSIRPWTPGEWLSLPDCLHVVRSSSPREPHHFSQTLPESPFFSSSSLSPLHSPVLELGKWWGGDRVVHHRRKATQPYWVVGKVLD